MVGANKGLGPIWLGDVFYFLNHNHVVING